MPDITLENSIPKKSTKYYLGEAVVRSQFNEVQFYFEDRDQQELYYSIMKKLFGEKIKFDKIFITNGKENAYELLKKHKNNNKKIFILDKDFDDLLRTKRRSVKNLFYLDRYCIENFLIEEDALIWTILFNKPTLNRVSLNLAYNNIMTDLMTDLQLLTSYFFLAKKLRISNYIQGFKTCSLAIDIFLKDTDKSEIDLNKLGIYWHTIEQAITTHMPGKDPDILLESAKKSIHYGELRIDGVFRHIPGKHFLELLRKKLNKRYPFMNTMKSGQMKFALADKCDFLSLINIKQQINTYLKIS